MKKVISIIFTFLIVAGCDDFLEEQPVSAVSVDTFWKTPDDAVVGMAAMYDALQRSLSENFFDWGEGRSDNFTAGGTGQFQVDIAVGNLSSTIAAASWTNLYRVIGIANSAIKYLPQIKDLEERPRNNYLAQAYAMRAYCYFYLVRVWGDVPVWLEPYEDLTENPQRARTSADEVLTNVVLADIDAAYSLVDAAITGPAWNINVGPILAIKTDVHMWRKEYQAALDASQLLIDLKRYALENSTLSDPAQKRSAIINGWKRIFTDPTGTKEAIWSLHWNFLQDGPNRIGSRTGSQGQTSQFEIDDPLLTLFEEGPVTQKDIRRGQTYDTLKITANVDQIWKYYTSINGVIQYQNVNQCESKLPLYRYADIILLRAEAYNKLGNLPDALLLLNQIRTRALLPALDAAEVPDELSMETAILKERQKEFVAEGKRWFDLVRTGRAVTVMDPVLRIRQNLRGLAETGFGDPVKILFPIHQDILNENKLLSQNAGYN